VISAVAPNACGSWYVVTYSHQRVWDNPRSCHWIRSFWNCLRSILQHSLYITSRSHDDDVFSFIRWLSRSFPLYCRHFNIIRPRTVDKKDNVVVVICCHRPYQRRSITEWV